MSQDPCDSPQVEKNVTRIIRPYLLDRLTETVTVLWNKHQVHNTGSGSENYKVKAIT